MVHVGTPRTQSRQETWTAAFASTPEHPRCEKTLCMVVSRLFVIGLVLVVRLLRGLLYEVPPFDGSQ